MGACRGEERANWEDKERKEDLGVERDKEREAVQMRRRGGEREDGAMVDTLERGGRRTGGKEREGEREREKKREGRSDVLKERVEYQ